MKVKYSIGLLLALILTTGVALAQQTPPPAPPEPDEPFENFSIFIEPDEISADTKHVNVSRRGISNRRRPTNAMWWHVAQVNIEAMFPE